MKKSGILVAFLGATLMFSACGSDYKSRKELIAENESLQIGLQKSNKELDDVMALFNDVQESFKLIKEAEGRVAVAASSDSKASREQIRKDLDFITQTLVEKREQIANLQSKLTKSQKKSANLQKALNNLQAELNAKNNELAELKKELDQKNIRIAQLDATVEGLNQNVAQLNTLNAEQKANLESADADINRAWLVIGTKKDLKASEVIKKGIMRSASVDKSDFKAIDIRDSKLIPVNSKKCVVLSSHPWGSFTIVSDADGMKSIQINDVELFWSVTRYLVASVK